MNKSILFYLRIASLLLAVMALPFLPIDAHAASPGDVIINEIMWDRSEYIELKNTTGSSINISN